ncbi:MAG: DUF2783 domain-containing protein [Rhodobacteraceae bacterium]|nr:DUF2783 domain-containing protein [Paracoccaceae bacterium]MCY4139412.1 DUF2783 domain-containing protein [Paracoccaceae bacterium]
MAGPDVLNTLDNIEDPDGFYDELIRLHDGLSEDESHALNARLILVLCNHIGDRNVLRNAFRIARECARTES